MIVEHATFLVGDNPELGMLVMNPAAAANSIAKMEKLVAAFRNVASSPSSFGFAGWRINHATHRRRESNRLIRQPGQRVMGDVGLEGDHADG